MPIINGGSLRALRSMFKAAIAVSKALHQQQLEIGLVVDSEDLCHRKFLL
jgi:hypothetical protein